MNENDCKQHGNRNRAFQKMASKVEIYHLRIVGKKGQIHFFFSWFGSPSTSKRLQTELFMNDNITTVDTWIGVHRT